MHYNARVGNSSRGNFRRIVVIETSKTWAFYDILLIMQLRRRQKSYSARPAKKSWIRRIITVLAILMIIAGLYLLYLVVIAPKLIPISVGKITIDQQNPPEKQLVIQKIGVNAPIVADDLSQLDEGKIIQRTNSGGDPEKGGNFVLSGHRFMMDYTPKRVQQKSVLYHLDKLEMGDEITVYWNHKPVTYKVSKIHEVKPNQIEIEDPTEEDKLTLYTCTLGGSYDGRLVVEALPVTTTEISN